MLFFPSLDIFHVLGFLSSYILMKNLSAHPIRESIAEAFGCIAHNQGNWQRKRETCEMEGKKKRKEERKIQVNKLFEWIIKWVK